MSSPPVCRGWVEVCDGTVIGFGPLEHRDDDGESRPAHHPGRPADHVIDLAGHIVLPALVNAHTHLELSGLRDRVPPASAMPDWARRAMSAMVDHPPDDQAIREAIRQATGSGTGLFGDISNTGAPVGALTESGASAVVFTELLGFDVQDGSGVVAHALTGLRDRLTECGGGAGVRAGLAAHAPYSVSPALFRAIRDVLDDEPMLPISVHLAESPEELEFLRTGRGAWRAILEERGRWDPTWTPPEGGPVAYLDALGWLTPRTVVVHGVQLTDRELDRLAETGATLVTCPRSNQWTGAGRPPVDRFYASGVRVAVGTDSLSSSPDLSVFAEMAEVRRLAPDVPASDILASATSVGAQALGFSDRGSIEVGQPAALIAVRCAETTDDVEEYLVQGIDPDQVVALESS